MGNKRLLLIGFFFLLGIGLIISLIFSRVFDHAFTALNKPVESSSWVLVVDFENDGIISQETLKKGKDAILTVNANESQMAPMDPWFTSLDALLRMDLNKDGIISSLDPAYAKLELVFFTNNGTQQIHMALRDVGIYALLIHTQRVTYLTKNQINSNYIIGHALLTDNTTRAIWLVPVDMMGVPEIQHRHFLGG